MVSKIGIENETTHPVPLIFLDTLHHFPETVQLAQTVVDTYLVDLHTYQPPGVATAEQFAAKYGDKLWESDEASYDYLVKVEPAARAYKDLGVRAVITGRRRSQGAERAGLKVLEVDERGLLKVNPLISWSFKEVKDYVDKEWVTGWGKLTAGACRTTLCSTRGTAPSATCTRLTSPTQTLGTVRSAPGGGRASPSPSAGCTRTTGT